MWSDVLENWDKWVLFEYPCQERFQWNTSVLKKNAPFQQSFKINLNLPINQNLSKMKGIPRKYPRKIPIFWIDKRYIYSIN